LISFFTIFPSRRTKLGDGEADRREGAELSEKYASSLLPGNPGDKDLCPPSYVVTCIVHPTCKSPSTSSEEAAHFLKFRLLSILESSQEGIDDISKNMRHPWIFDFLLVAPRCECLRDSGKMT
jgi:hypothetical protein